MSKHVQALHYPTLLAVLTVEDIVKNAELAITKKKIAHLLPKTMRFTLDSVLNYLEKNGFILDVGKRGRAAFIWTYNPTLERLHRKSPPFEWKPYKWT